MSPLADAMRFVNRQKGNWTSLHKIPQSTIQGFRSEKDQLMLATPKGREAGFAFLEIQCGIDLNCPEPQLSKSIHLILHEADQRRQDQYSTIQEAGRKLVSQRLPCSGGHYRYAVAS